MDTYHYMVFKKPLAKAVNNQVSQPWTSVRFSQESQSKLAWMEILNFLEVTKQFELVDWGLGSPWTSFG
jgi:hypothetical protein